MRRFALVLALLLVAAPSFAAKYVGTWYPGDNVRLLRFDVRDDSRSPWGTAVGSGYTPTLEVRKAGTTAVFAILSGAWEDSTDTAVLFSPGAETLLVPAQTSPATQGLYQDYDAILVLTRGLAVARLGSDGVASPFRIRIQVWP